MSYYVKSKILALEVVHSVAGFTAVMGWAIGDGVGKHTAVVFVDFGSRSVLYEELTEID